MLILVELAIVVLTPFVACIGVDLWDGDLVLLPLRRERL